MRISGDLLEDLKQKRIRPLGDTSYFLAEFRSSDISHRALGLIHELKVLGYTIIMAHPERNLALQRSSSLVEELRDLGVLFQATANCFAPRPDGRDDRQSAKFAWSLLEQGRIYFIASDTHNTSSRPPGLLEAYDNIAARLGEDVSLSLLENANA